MRKASAIVTLAVLVATSFATLTILPTPVKAATLYVGGSGPGNYTHIGLAVAAASPGDTIYVYGGVYLEQVEINKPLTLIGNYAIIHAGWLSVVVRISSDWVNFTGFSVSIEYEGGAAILVSRASHCSITKNDLGSNGAGVVLADSTHITITNNWFDRSGIEIYGESLEHWNTHTIDSSNIVNWKPLYYWRDIAGGTVAPGAGQVILANCTGVVVENQDVPDASVGILVGFSSGILITHNTVFSTFNEWKSDIGITLQYSNNNTISANTLSINYRGIELYYSNNNTIYHNRFIGNREQAYDYNGANQWDNSYPSGGNYWSDYAGVDQKSGPGQNLPGSDGIGDTPYEIDYGTRDRYPLMSSTVPPPPRAPPVVRATLSGRNSENVTLTWFPSPDDGAGFKTVVGYDIRRGSKFDPEGSWYALIASVPDGTKAFVDAFAGEQDPSNYFYLVCAIDVNGSGACAPNQAGKFTRPLSRGPSLISIPLIQSKESIETVLQTVEYGKAWHYDSFSQEWKWSMKSKGYRRELWSINHTMGLWLNVTEYSNLAVAGIVPAQTTIHLHKGWNLVSFPSFLSYSISDLKAVAPVERVEAFDSTAPPHFLRVLTDSDALMAGQGYWVKTSEDATWVVPNT